MLMTTTLAARRLGVSHERVLGWVTRKLLPIAGEDEEGRVLLREPVVMERGEALAADTPERLRSPRLRQLWAASAPTRVLSCGCAFTSDSVNNEPLIRCADARGLQATAGLAQALVAAAPNEPFFRLLAEVTRNALARHLDGSNGPEPASDSSDAANRRAQSIMAHIFMGSVEYVAAMRRVQEKLDRVLALLEDRNAGVVQHGPASADEAA